jgi:hypothetical protein
MYVERNNVTRSRNVYTSSDLLLWRFNVAGNDKTYLGLRVLFLVRQPPVGQSLLIHEVSRSHTTTHQSVGLLWKSEQLVAETST